VQHLAVGELEQAVGIEGIPGLDVVEVEYQPFLGCRIDNLLDISISPCNGLPVLACADVQVFV
jgi:NADPH-dependent 7-cyano-7-deazaguanine reductase QueF-like protein